MTGWLVYDSDNVARNRFFIDRWMDAAARRGVDLRLVYAQDLAMGVDGNALFVRHPDAPAPAFAVMRAQHPVLSEQFEKMGVPCYNSARVAALCNDKQRTHQLFAGRLPMMDTAFVSPGAFTQPFPYPVVVKAAHGCGGRQVYMARDEAAYREALGRIAPDTAAVQPVCDTPGQDQRVYVLDGRVVGSFLRYQPKDFRSNIGLGGGSRPMEMAEDIRRYVDVVLGEMQVGLVGIDFIFHQGRAVFNEIEDAVGTRMLYQHTALDIADAYLAMILNKM